VQYAGASGDFNIIHWNERFAKAVGLPDVIAHGMFTMATAARLVTDWAGDPAAVVEYGVRFSSMVPVPDDDKGTALVVSGTVEEKLEAKRVSVVLTARVAGVDGAKVLTQARAVVQLS
jgi:acyl dehydratase